MTTVIMVFSATARAVATTANAELPSCCARICAVLALFWLVL
jgi:hypothetical protein